MASPFNMVEIRVGTNSVRQRMFAKLLNKRLMVGSSLGEKSALRKRVAFRAEYVACTSQVFQESTDNGSCTHFSGSSRVVIQ
jgi:hypothetical protein